MSSSVEMTMKIRGCVHRVGRLLSAVPPTVTRISLGLLFAESGWGKLHNLPKVIGFFQELGIPGAAIQAPFVATTELVCGLLVLFGLCTRLASVPLAVTMVVATITAKRESIGELTDLFSVSEYLFIVLFIWLFVYGAGPLSLDRLLVRKLRFEEKPV
jgi:putative oxidoreductase